MAKKVNRVVVKRDSLRVHKHLFTLNDAEEKVLNRFLDKYKISNKSKYIRETLMKSILRKFEEDSPTLFD
jgi:hypothetical protein